MRVCILKMKFWMVKMTFWMRKRRLWALKMGPLHSHPLLSPPGTVCSSQHCSKCPVALSCPRKQAPFHSIAATEKGLGMKRSRGKVPQMAPLPGPCSADLRAMANCKTLLPHSGEGPLHPTEELTLSCNFSFVLLFISFPSSLCPKDRWVSAKEERLF